LPSVDVDVPVRDPDDAPVVGAAVAAEAEVIVSGDADLIEDDDLVGWLRARGINVLTPAEFLERLPSS
jgi:predicted nucleic acid-binding protein